MIIVTENLDAFRNQSAIKSNDTNTDNFELKLAFRKIPN